MPATKRAFNSLGLWLNNELAKRNILFSDFARTAETTPQNLSDLMRGNRFSDETLKVWREKFEKLLQEN